MDDGHGNPQRTVHPCTPSPPLTNRSGTATSISQAFQGEASGNGLSVVLNAGMSYSTPSSEPHTVTGSSLMSSDNDTSGFNTSTAGMRWISQPPSQRPPYSTPPLRSHITPFFSPGALHPASLPRQTSEPTFPSPMFPQTSSGPLHTHHTYFTGQYLVPSHLPFHSSSAQSHLHDGYSPSGSGFYPPTGYYPLPLHPPLPCFRNEASMQSSPSYQQQTQYLPMLMPQILPGPSHSASSGGARQYQLSSYSSTTHTGLPKQSQRDVPQWHQNSSSSRNMSSTRAQQHHLTHTEPRSQPPGRDSNTLTVLSTESGRLPSPNLGTSSNPLVSTSQNTTTTGLPEQNCAQDHDICGPSHRSEATTRRANDRPLVRRRYHPDPPPARSEWVMWVGNVPSDANHNELWRFLSSPTSLSPESKDSGRVENSGLISLFLISRSNCAFVNYRSEEELNNAIIQFNGLRLRHDDPRCPRLVCRARRRDDDLRAGVGAQRGMGIHTGHIKGPANKNELTGDAPTSSKDRRLETMRDEQPAPQAVPRDGGTSESDPSGGTSPNVPTHSPSSYASTTSSFLIHYFPKRFFILKSLTQYDLDLSVERGMWATQKHNESILDQAFRTSKEVILIFSVNKSGEFYGYARMASAILRSNRDISWASRADASTRIPSPAPGDSPSHGTLGSSSHQSLEPLPDKTKVNPPSPSSSKSKPAQERRSAPPAFTRFPEDPRSPLQRKPHSAPLPPSGKQIGVRTGRSNNVSLVDEAGDCGSQLQPVMEEGHQGSGEGHPRLLSTAAQSQGLPSRLEVQQDEPSWGETFRVEWLRTDRVPFHRTRHLRNPWNHGREVKVARDGTEIEPSVGQQLVEDWTTFAGTVTGRRGPQSGGVTPSPSGKTKGVQ